MAGNEPVGLWGEIEATWIDLMRSEVTVIASWSLATAHCSAVDVIFRSLRQKTAVLDDNYFRPCEQQQAHSFL